MCLFADLLIEATRAISPGYFRVDIDTGIPVYRERVYCYELYHQLRSRWPAEDRSRYVLHGELSKAGHPIFREFAINRAMPDLLVHSPGYMQHNFVVLEAKCELDDDSLLNDIQKLARFVRDAGYPHAIMLYFGEHVSPDDLISRATNAALQIGDLPAVAVWLHSRAGDSATPLATVGNRTDHQRRNDDLTSA